MLLVTHVRDEHRKAVTDGDLDKKGIELLKVPRSHVPAITHVDFSARVQTVHAETNPLYWETIRLFREETGVPLVINTSFNVRGEPIVCTPEDAWNCFAGTEMDALVIGPYLLRKEAQKAAVIEDVQQAYVAAATIVAALLRYLEEGPGSTAFGAGQDRALAATRELQDAIYQVGMQFLSAEELARFRTEVEALAREQPIRGPDFAAQTVGAALTEARTGMRFAWEIFPCGELAGDTLNIFHLDRDRIGFFVLDVSGHGASAAMMSMAIHRLLAPSPGPPSVLFRRKPGGDGYKIAEPELVCHDLNVHFQMGPDLAQYFTLIYGILDGRTGGVRLVR